MGILSSNTPLTVMLSIGGCTNTYVGTLDSPRADAVTWAAPVPPGVQVVKATSQCPAQATPLGAMFRTEVSLEEKVMGTARFVPEVVCADALKPNVAPKTTEVLLLGVRLTFPGKSGVLTLEPLPQPPMLHKERTAIVNGKTFKRDLPMHPSSLMKHSYGSA